MKRQVQTTLKWSSPRKCAGEPPGEAAQFADTVTAGPLRRSFSQIWSDRANDENLEVDREILEESPLGCLEKKSGWESNAVRRAT